VVIDESEATEAFMCADRMKMGKIDTRSLPVVIRWLGYKAPDEVDFREMAAQIAQGSQRGTLFREVDERGDGFVTFDDFMYIVRYIAMDSDSAGDILASLATLDKGGKGYMTLAELRSYLSHAGAIPPAYIEQLLKAADVDGTGRVNFVDLIQLLGLA
jgi:Ca2+-binding EF-hand superfamily protein